jgi:hypothetical protein
MRFTQPEKSLQINKRFNQRSSQQHYVKNMVCFFKVFLRSQNLDVNDVGKSPIVASRDAHDFIEERARV